MLDVSAIPIFLDNYVWLLSDGVDAIVVDPGDAAPVITVLARQQLRLAAVLVTHHHPDHIAGIAELLHGRDIPVYGPRAEAAKIKTLTQLLDDGDSIDLLGRKFEIIALPGHTLGHIAYATPGTLLCGDTLFSAGCGRLFEGTPAQMWQSLSRLAALPGDTRVYCTHEYTLSNLAFAAAVEPANAAIGAHIECVQTLRANRQPSLPTTLTQELQINPFLRTQQPDVTAAASRWSGDALHTELEVFTALRRWKDRFKPPSAT
ncbi:MAG: hydroxyacylglutathione hydrolase [Stenotrophobium sp.]